MEFSSFVLESRYSCSKVENFIGVIYLGNDITLSFVFEFTPLYGHNFTRTCKGSNMYKNM